MELVRTNDTKEKRKLHPFKELDQDLVIDENEVVGSGTFGSCFSAVYRGNFGVTVKVMNTKDSLSKEMECAKQEVIHEAQVIANLGDHPCIPHLFGVCINRAPFYLVLQPSTIHLSQSVSLTARLWKHQVHHQAKPQKEIVCSIISVLSLSTGCSF